MIVVRVRLDEDGCLASVSVSGHASTDQTGRGGNVVCAAVTGLIRSCADAIAERTAIVATGAAPHPGQMRFDIVSREDDGEWLRGVTDVMLCGVRRISGDSPGEVQLTVERTGVHHGA